MKTLLLKVFLVSCVLFLGMKNAEAVTLTVSTSGITNSPTTVAYGQTAAVIGFSAVVSTGTAKLSTVKITTASGYLSDIRATDISLVSSNSANYTTATVLNTIPTTIATTATTFTLTLTGTQTINTTTGGLYYFIVINFANPATLTTLPDSYSFTLSTVTTTTPNLTSSPGTTKGPYNFTTASIAEAQTTGGLAANPITGTQTNVGLIGLKLTSTGNSSFSSLTFTTSQAVSSYFTGNVRLYSSANPIFSTGTATQIGSMAVPASTTITFSGLTQTITDGNTMYYYLVMDNYTPPATSASFEADITTITTGINTNTTITYADKTGTNYSLPALVTLGTALTTGLATGTLNVNTTNQGILGFAVTTSVNETFTSFQFSSAQTIGTYFTNLRLISCSTSNYSTGTKTTIATVTGAALNTTSLTITGFTPQVVNNTTQYYFIEADYVVGSSASVSFQLNATTASTSSASFTNGGPIAGSALTLSSGTYNWVGNTLAGGVYAWSTAANWSPAAVPGPFDNAQVGISSYTSGHDPVVNAAASVGSITFGDHGNNNMSLTVNSTLTVNGDITKNNDPSSETVTLGGSGTINVVNVNVLSNDESNNFFSLTTVTEGISSSVNTLNISGNINLTSDIYTGFFSIALDEAAFTVTGGTTNITGTTTSAGIVNTSNDYINFLGNIYSLSVLSVNNGATLNVYNPNFLSGLSNTDESDINFNTGSIVQYLGNNQTVYTNSISTANAGSGVSYSNLVINGTGSATTATGTLTVNNNFTNSSNTNLAANSTIVNVSGQLIPTADTLTCGPGTLTAGSMHFTGGNLTASSGTVTCSGTYTNDGGLFNCGTAANAKVYFGGAYTNNSGTFTANPTNTSSVYFTGTNQSMQDNTTAGTTLNNVTFSGNNTAISASTGAAGTGNFAIANTGTLTMGTNAKLTAGSGSTGGAGYLTLLSTASSTASVAQMPTTSSIVGAVNVQRSITGGTGTRGYRLLTSPVNISTNATGAGNLSLAYLNTNASFGGVTYPGALTMGPGTGFTINGSTNPIIYLYDETRATNNTGYTTGKNIGIFNIASTSVTTLTGTAQAGATIPVGNSYLLYYVGNNTSTVVANTRVPDNTVITATGYLNQGGTSGTIPVKFWKLGTTAIPYDITAGTSYPGLNQVGNPFPCTISLNQLSADNTAISKVFWELIPGGGYVSYSAATGHMVSDARASNYIVSGQGFLIQAQGTGETLTFKEGEKVSPYPTGLATPFNTATGTALLMSLPTKPSANTDVTAQSITTSPIIASAMTPAPTIPDSVMQAYLATRPSPSLIGLHLQITKDSLNYIQTGIYFNNTISNDNYSQINDAVNINGSGAQVFLTSYSADNVSLGINQLSDYTKGKRIKLYAAVASTGLYNISLADIANIDTGMYNVYLVDKKMNDSLDMVRYRSYAFNIDNNDTTTYGANRFVLAIERKTLPPYQLIKFSGQKVSTGVQLNWQTLNEGNYTGFALQKLTNTGNYNTLYTLQSNSSSNYSYIDKHPLTGNNTYKLQQTDINGKITYSAPVTINYNSNSPNGSINVYPNPSKSIITVSLALNTTAAGYIADIYNTSGTIISHQVVKANTWTQDISSYKLGVYIIEVKTNSGDLVGKSKFVKIN